MLLPNCRAFLPFHISVVEDDLSGCKLSPVLILCIKACVTPFKNCSLTPSLPLAWKHLMERDVCFKFLQSRFKEKVSAVFYLVTWSWLTWRLESEDWSYPCFPPPYVEYYMLHEVCICRAIHMYDIPIVWGTCDPEPCSCQGLKWTGS